MAREFLAWTMRAPTLIALLLVARAHGMDEAMWDILNALEPGELGFEVYRETTSQIHLTCFAVNGTYSDGGEVRAFVTQKTRTELMNGQVGTASDKPEEDAAYPCDNQNSWGQMNLRVEEVNGASLDGVDAESAVVEGYEGLGIGGRTPLSGSAHVTLTVNQDLTIDTYMFTNAAAQEAANLEHTMTIGDLDACKMEVIYAFKPKAAGGLDVGLEVQLHAFGIDETDVNAALMCAHTIRNASSQATHPC